MKSDIHSTYQQPDTRRRAKGGDGRSSMERYWDISLMIAGIALCGAVAYGAFLFMTALGTMEAAGSSAQSAPHALPLDAAELTGTLSKFQASENRYQTNTADIPDPSR